MLIGFYETTLVRLDSYPREIQLLSPRLSPHAQEKLIRLHGDHSGSGFDLRDDRSLLLLDRGNPGLQVDLSPIFLEVLLHHPDEVRVRPRKELVSEFYDSYLAPQFLVHARELH